MRDLPYYANLRDRELMQQTQYRAALAAIRIIQALTAVLIAAAVLTVLPKAIDNVAATIYGADLRQTEPRQ